MPNSIPYVSVIMPVFNGEQYLSEAIDSVLAQTFQDWELIVVDDCSTDSTPQILESYTARDPRIRALRNARNLKSGPSSNRGISIARAGWISRLDADDVYEPHFLEKMAAVTRGLQGMDHFVSSWTKIIDSEGGHIVDVRLPDAAKIARMMPIENFLYHGATQFPKALWAKTGGYPEIQRESDDLALWKKFLKAGARLHVVPEHLMRYRIHDSNMTLGNSPTEKWDPKDARTYVKNAEWRISLLLKQGKLPEARVQMRELFEAAGASVKRAFYYLLTFLPRRLVYLTMWEVRPRLRTIKRRLAQARAA